MVALARDFPDPPIIERDGTSQAGRVQPALDPAYVAVEERSTRDLLQLAQQYAKELRYHDERDELDGDWSGFLGHEDLQQLAELVDSSAALVPGAALRTDRPHLALFLAFLRLLRHPRDLVNALTRRHLRFYYEQLLRMSRKPPIPDRVHVLFRLATGVDRARLVSGTALRAGKDSVGRERIYRTDHELVVSRTKVVRQSTVYVHKEITGLREARERHRANHEEALLRMLEIALGDPRPGDALPPYGDQKVTYALLRELEARVGFAAESLFMDLSDLHAMVRLRRQRADDAAEWEAINVILEKAGRARPGDPGDPRGPLWTLRPADPRAFDANLARALGERLDFERDGLSGVKSLKDLYEQRIRDDVRIFITTRLFPSKDDSKDDSKKESLEDFYTMMRIKMRIDNEWQEINRILEHAGRRRRKDPSYRLEPSMASDFTANLEAAVGPLSFAALPHAILPTIADIDAYYDAILAIEAYFHMTAWQVGYILSTAEKPLAPGATEREWENVVRLLSDAYQDKVYAARRHALWGVCQGAQDLVTGFRAMLRVALGKAAGEPREPLLDLSEHLSGADHAFLTSVQLRLATDTITADEWRRVYQVVELAQRVREKLTPPVAQRESWLDLDASDDATKVTAGAAEPAATLPRWKTFGQRPPKTILEVPAPCPIGWAISSPLLLLGQGKRTIVLTLGLTAKSDEAFRLLASSESGAEPSPFVVQVSTGTGWLTVTAGLELGDYQTLSNAAAAQAAQPARIESLRAVQLTLTLGEDAAAVAPSDETAWAAAAAPWPVLRLLLSRVWDAARQQYISPYEPLRDLTLLAVHLGVKVERIVPASIQNDDAVLSSKKPFEPFGPHPVVGARFYVGDPELVVKRLDNLTFHIEWSGGPANLMQHYANYPDPGSFTTEIRFVDNRLRLPLTPEPVPLFTGLDATKPRDLELAAIPVFLQTQGYHYRPWPELPVSTHVTAWRRYFEWELTPTDFKHQAYPIVAAQKALELTAAIARPPATINPASFQVKPPYTPKIKTLRVDYSSQTQVLFDAQDTSSSDRLFHVHPFGVSPIEADSDGDGIRFLPRYDHEGELYLGIQNARPPETLSLLFQMAEGSANPDLAPVTLEWRYLSGDRWLTLHDGNLRLDTTNGLIDSGIVEIVLPPAVPSTRFPGDLYWIRVAIPHHVDSVGDTVAIHAQAVSATFADHDNAPDHLARRLPERSITSLLQRMPQIAAVEQPFPSRRGRAAEAEGGFFTRVSERLRHKQRALTVWDYERLVLEGFPELYKVKCIPADATQEPDHPGLVDIVVVPEIRGQSIANPFEPKAPAALLAAIERYLASKRPPLATVRVRNAHFVQVKVRVAVRFRGSGDEGFYKMLLNDQLNRFLSPWAYEEGADIVIGGKIFANSIVSFIDSRDYVDYVTNIKLFRIEGGQSNELQPPPSQPYFVSAERPDGILVAARQHVIDVIPETGYMAASFTGINYMKIELDFVVAGADEPAKGTHEAPP